MSTTFYHFTCQAKWDNCLLHPGQWCAAWKRRTMATGGKRGRGPMGKHPHRTPGRERTTQTSSFCTFALLQVWRKPCRSLVRNRRRQKQAGEVGSHRQHRCHGTREQRPTEGDLGMARVRIIMPKASVVRYMLKGILFFFFFFFDVPGESRTDDTRRPTLAYVGLEPTKLLEVVLVGQTGFPNPLTGW